MIAYTRTALAFLVAAAMITPASAENTKRLKAAPGASVVFVWNDESAQDEGIRIIQAGGELQLLIPLLACLARPGESAVIRDFGFLTSDITVINGEHAGCRGNVATEYLE